MSPEPSFRPPSRSRTPGVLRVPRPFRVGALHLLTCLLVSSVALVVATPADALERGDRGHGLSVFQGDQPERFEVEILGRVEGWGSAGSTILARLSGAGLETTGVLQGMSGSPVWVDGELVGAIMSTWGFASEPIAGIRPIEEMRQLAADIDAASPTRTEDADLEMPHAPDGLAWSASGFAPRLREDMERRLGAPLAAFAAQAAPADGGAEQPDTLEAGDAVSVMLVDGDARLFATGTVTERIGDTILAFGHPFLGAGGVSLPMARAEVVTVMPSRQISFKIAAPTRTVGALRLDRRAGISGRLGEVADTIPVDVRVAGVAEGTGDAYHFELARLRGMTPQLLAWAVQSAVDERRELGAGYEARLSVVASIEGREPLRSEAVLTGPGLGEQLGGEVALPLQLLEQLRDTEVRIDAVEVALELVADTRAASLARARVDDPRLEPGGILRARVELRPRGRSARWVDLRLQVPETLQPGPYRLHVTDGATAFAEEIARTAPRWRDLGMRQVRDALALRRPSDRLVAVLYGPSTSLIVDGVEYRDLPGTVRTVLGRTWVSRGAPDAAATPLARVEADAGTVVRGAAYVDLVVEPTKRVPRAEEKGENGERERRRR